MANYSDTSIVLNGTEEKITKESRNIEDNLHRFPENKPEYSKGAETQNQKESEKTQSKGGDR